MGEKCHIEQRINARAFFIVDSRLNVEQKKEMIIGRFWFRVKRVHNTTHVRNIRRTPDKHIFSRSIYYYLGPATVKIDYILYIGIGFQ